MFTRTIRSQMLLGKSGVRWDAPKLSDVRVDLGMNTLLVEPKLLLDIKDMPFDAQKALLETMIPKLSTKELEWILKFLTQEAEKTNKFSGSRERNDILAPVIQDALKTRIDVGTNKTLMRAAANPDASVELRRDVDSVSEVTHSKAVRALPAGVPIVSQNNALRPAQNLKNDPTVQALVGTYNEQYVNKRELLQALSRAITNFWPYDKVYERVTGERPLGNPADVQKFQKALNINIAFLQQFGGGTAGLDALLSGKTELYLGQVAANRNNIKTIRPPEGAISPQAQTIAGAAATVLVGVATGGIVMVWHEADRVEADAFIQKFQKNAEWGIGNTLGNALVWIKEALMGRKLSITLGANEKEGNVDKYYEAIRAFTEKVMKTPDLSLSTDSEIRSMYLAAKWFAEKANILPTDERFKKALIQSYILNEWFARQGVDWKANIGLLFVGSGREDISLRQVRWEGNDTERSVVKRTIDSRELASAWIRIEKNAEGKWVHMIPASVQFSWDIEKINVDDNKLGRSYINPNGTQYEIVTDKVQTLHFSERNGLYVLTISDASNQPPSEATSAEGDADIQQVAGSVRNIRENGGKLSFADKLYFIWHTDPVAFSPLLRALGAQDEAGVRSALWSLKNPKYRAIVVQLQKDIPTLMQVWNTYTYGTSKHRSIESVNQKGYNSMRTASVLASESRLAKQNGITGVTPESKFQSEKYSPKQLSSIYAGQEMTVACFATPLADGKTGVHRIDTMDGSFAVHDTTVELSWDYKDQVIDSMKGLVKNDTRGIRGQVDKLNLFLSRSGLGKDMGSTSNAQWEKVSQIVTEQQYIDYLKTGDIAQLWVSGLQLQKDKGTRVFEARAMIAGNVCLNRTHGIVYPLFETATQKQSADTVVSLDYSTPTKVTEVDASQAALWVNPIAVAANLGNSHDGSSRSWGTKTQPGQIEKPISGLPNTPPATWSVGNTGSQTVVGWFVPPKP